MKVKIKGKDGFFLPFGLKEGGIPASSKAALIANCL
jgi:hypothetical protein